MTANAEKTPAPAPALAKTEDEFTYTLMHPTEVRGKQYTVLTIRRPLVRDLIAADRQPGGVGSAAALIATCAGVPVGDFGYFDASDFRDILARGEALGFFAAGDNLGAAGGETPSS